MGDVTVAANITQAETVKTTTRPHFTNTSAPTSDGPVFIAVFANSYWIYVYLVLQCVYGVCSIFLNSVVFSFYWGHVSGENRNRKRNRVYYFLYVMLSLADLLRGITALFHALVLGFVIHYASKVIVPLCYLILILSSLSSHLSILLNVLISVLRTFHIVKPTMTLEPEILLAPIVMYSVLWGALSSYDVYLLAMDNIAAKAEHVMLYILIAPRIFSLFGYLDKFDRMLEYALVAIGLPYIIPTIICIVCACVQVAYLLKMNVRSTANARITVTIFILTICFFACNVPYFLYFCLSLNVWTDSSDFIGSPGTIFCYFVANFPSTINSILNPMILLSRGRTLQKHFISVIPLVRSFFPGSERTRDRTHMESYMTSRAETRAAVARRDMMSTCPETTRGTCEAFRDEMEPDVSVNIHNDNRVGTLVD
ncbi:uncharacterized protein LOC134823375 [Bolinopsis microptera]|uniref:uncharacterized protein LOC134823375 n=1 Tax=Bolinopsis microptera TaxID=2820187 RepID=UPI003078F5E7